MGEKVYQVSDTVYFNWIPVKCFGKHKYKISYYFFAKKSSVLKAIPQSYCIDSENLMEHLRYGNGYYLVPL